MIEKAYNGWSANIRNIRGALAFKLRRKGLIAPPVVCELCCSTRGVTYHAEDYGSTWEDYRKCCHPLCCYCHATIHVRKTYPQRWKRFVHRALTGTLPEFPYTSLYEVYTQYRGIKDLPEYHIPEELLSSDHWLLALETQEYSGPEKLALVSTAKGVYTPDFTIYPESITELSGVRYDSTSFKLIPFLWSKNDGTPGK